MSNERSLFQIDIKMLDLEVVPERSLGNEQWEFILGELCMIKKMSLFVFIAQHNAFDYIYSIGYKYQ
jgi:hypothetical protein